MFLFKEPLSGWYRHVEVVNAILRVGALLTIGATPKAEDWKLIESDEFLGYPLRISSVTPRNWEALLYILDRWLLYGNIRPQLNPQDRGSGLTFGGDTWSTLGFQVALAVTGSGRTAVCDGCNRVYSRARKPQRGRRNFCQICNSDGTSARMRQRDYAARNPDKVKANFKNRAKGTSATEVQFGKRTKEGFRGQKRK